VEQYKSPHDNQHKKHGQDKMAYLIPIYLILVAILGFRSVFISWKFIHYVQQNYPEISKKIGCPIDGYHNGFKFMRALYHQDNLNDSKYCYLKTKSRNALTLALGLFMLFVFVFLSFVLLVYILSYLKNL
jgi:predicted PurR-regulated permease PerM